MLSAVAYSDFYSGQGSQKQNSVRTYARQIAYLGDPERIKRYVEREFGCGKISLAECRDILRAAQRSAQPARNLGDGHESPFDENAAGIVEGSKRLLDALQRAQHGIWPCGCLRTPENIHTVAGIGKCRTCRRKRWNKGLRQVVNRKLAEALIMERREHNNAKARQEAYAKAFPRTGSRKPIDLVISLVEAEFDLSAGALISRGRKKMQVFARSIVVRILRDRGVSYPRIGNMLRRDHTTILNMDRKWPVYISQCPKVLEVYQAVEADK